MPIILQKQHKTHEIIQTSNKYTVKVKSLKERHSYCTVLPEILPKLLLNYLIKTRKSYREFIRCLKYIFAVWGL